MDVFCLLANDEANSNLYESRAMTLRKLQKLQQSMQRRYNWANVLTTNNTIHKGSNLTYAVADEDLNRMRKHHHINFRPNDSRAEPLIDEVPYIPMSPLKLGGIIHNYTPRWNVYFLKEDNTFRLTSRNYVYVSIMYITILRKGHIFFGC